MSLNSRLKDIPLILRQDATKDLNIKISKDNKYTNKEEFINVFRVDDNVAYFPYYYAKEKLKIPGKLRKDYPKANIVYKNDEYPLRSHQVTVKSQAINLLNKNGCCILALYMGFGKTITSLYLASKLGLKVLYINNNLNILGQLFSAVEKYTFSKVQLLKSKSVLDPSADVYIINAINVPKFKKGSFNCIGTVIIDEIHRMLSKVLSQALHYVTPRYLIGLSATPYRDDGLDILFDLYFGSEKIHEILNHEHIVYKLESPLKPVQEYTKSGGINWGSILNEQADNVERNEKIIEILQKFSDKIFIVICKRVSQIIYLEKRLSDLAESLTTLYGAKTVYDTNARILIGTHQKVGVGFDHPKINAMILAGDVESYFIQTLGRAMRTPTVKPLIFDIVDKNPSLNKHWRIRKEVYLKHGGTVKIMDWSTLKEIEKPKINSKRPHLIL